MLKRFMIALGLVPVGYVAYVSGTSIVLSVTHNVTAGAARAIGGRPLMGIVDRGFGRLATGEVVDPRTLRGQRYIRLAS